MALEQPNNQPQSIAQRPPVGDGGEAMPNQGDAMPNQQAQGQEQEQGQNQEQQIQEFQQRVQQLPPQEKQVLAQSLTPDFRNITVKVFGSEISIFFDILESGIEETQPTPTPEPPMMAGGQGEGFANRPPEQPQGGGMVQRPQPV